MKTLVGWFAKNSVTANLLMFILVVGGLLAYPSIKKEVFPEFTMDMVLVSVAYPGASPEEVEESICVKIEEEIEDLSGISKISSVAGESVGTVAIEVSVDADSRTLMEDIKSRVDAIDTFPDDAEKPTVTELVAKHQVINIAISGDVDAMTLKKLGEKIRDELIALPQITQVKIVSTKPYEVTINLSEENMRRHKITFDEVSLAIKRSSIDLPGGVIKTKGGEVRLRTKGRAYYGDEFENIVIRTRSDGTLLKLKDIAKVTDGFAEVDKIALFNGKPSVNIQVFRVGNQNVTKVADAVKKYVKQKEKTLPEGITLTTWMDNSSIFKSRLDLLRRNGTMGFILVFIILMLFLRFRLAFWVSLGIPISFLGAVWVMPGLDASINMLSMFSFILVLGIVVDDAIIVGESIYTHQRKGEVGVKAAVGGVQEVSIPVVFAVLTTMAAFFPMLTLPGYMGDIWSIIPKIVIPCLFFSLVECLLILPAHLSHFNPEKDRSRRGLTGLWKKFQERFSLGLEKFVKSIYTPVVKWALQRRYIIFALAVTLLMLTFGFVASGKIKLIFFPEVEADFVIATVSMPKGTPVETTAKAVKKLEESALAIQKEFKIKIDGQEKSVVRHVLSAVGEQPMTTMQQQQGGGRAGIVSEPHLGEVIIELIPSEDRGTTSSKVIADRWRQLTGFIPDTTDLTFSASLMGSSPPLDFELSAYDITKLQEAAEELKTKLVEYSGVYDVSDSYEGGKKELKFNIKPSAQALGVTLADLGRQIRQAFYGEEAQTIQRGRDDVKVMIRYPLNQRHSIGDVENMRIRTPAGLELPLSEVATVTYGQSYTSIQRTDRKRTINVTADLDTAKANARDIKNSILENFMPKLIKKYPGLSYALKGEQKEMADTLQALVRKFILALLIIFVLLAIPFKSYIQPVIVMLAIPFGLIGAVIGHGLVGLDLSILSLLGIIALVGVVVNDSLVLVSYINRKRESLNIIDAVKEAGAIRFRPILLTSLTTFAGLTPLMLEKSMQAKFMIPMAISLAFGVLFATVITLFIVPCAYIILDDIKSMFRKILGIKRS